MKLTVHEILQRGPMPFRVRCYLDLGGNSSGERLWFAKYGAPPLTEPPQEFDVHGPLPAALLTADELQQLVSGQGLDRDFDNVRKALTFAADIRKACKTTVKYWHAAVLFPTD